MSSRTLPPMIQARQADVALLCRRTRARRLGLFGSAARGSFEPGRSDLDFLVTFDDLPPADYADAYFALKEGLETLFGQPVDLVTEPSMRNPFLIKRVQAERLEIYGS